MAQNSLPVKSKPLNKSNEILVHVTQSVLQRTISSASDNIVMGDVCGLKTGSPRDVHYRCSHGTTSPLLLTAAGLSSLFLTVLALRTLVVRTLLVRDDVFIDGAPKPDIRIRVYHPTTPLEHGSKRGERNSPRLGASRQGRKYAFSSPFILLSELYKLILPCIDLS
ncbi:hypothetical protein AX14_008052 [Amanita brunnescens Koide BX004]|nr:hypothetical protein AX14_008052 [Amanita brunnescens Koide BX004]